MEHDKSFSVRLHQDSSPGFEHSCEKGKESIQHWKAWFSGEVFFLLLLLLLLFPRYSAVLSVYYACVCSSFIPKTANCDIYTFAPLMFACCVVIKALQHNM